MDVVKGFIGMHSDGSAYAKATADARHVIGRCSLWTS